MSTSQPIKQRTFYKQVISDSSMLKVFKAKLKAGGIVLPPAPKSGKDHILAVSWEFDMMRENNRQECMDLLKIIKIANDRSSWLDDCKKIKFDCWVISKASLKVEITAYLKIKTAQMEESIQEDLRLITRELEINQELYAECKESSDYTEIYKENWLLDIQYLESRLKKYKRMLRHLTPIEFIITLGNYKQTLNLKIYSEDIELEDERELKKLGLKVAQERGLLDIDLRIGGY